MVHKKENLPEINLKELKKFKEQNFKDRLEFIKKYAEWVKKSKDWDVQQKSIINNS
jgi:hypothetical protein